MYVKLCLFSYNCDEGSEKNDAQGLIMSYGRHCILLLYEDSLVQLSGPERSAFMQGGLDRYELTI